ncbi:uncharacterized protein LOC119631953 isoform X2 [Glossina fuscipes]|uniref:Uncharacterized protein LOC119631953 isoform X2 n=1 Tax=Glossina fuscipes TaxID=7396 RepID=A0A8U0W5Y5_9MUSC|nr:uncharacterized protein LOC119631953 isoform X2 [Glossina fuscipes]
MTQGFLITQHVTLCEKRCMEKMDSYLMEIKQLRIPRPKYGPSGSSPTRYHLDRPYTPPRDYNISGNENSLNSHTTAYQEGGEDFQPSSHNKF